MLTRLRLENFKSWEDTGDIDLKPITGFFGPNSSGKTSLFQALLLMKQTYASLEPEIVFHFGDETALVNLGEFESVIHEHDTSRSLRISLKWNSKNDFKIPDEYDGGAVAEGDDFGFKVALRDIRLDAAKPRLIEDMFYETADRWFATQPPEDLTDDGSTIISSYDEESVRCPTDSLCAAQCEDQFRRLFFPLRTPVRSNRVHERSPLSRPYPSLPEPHPYPIRRTSPSRWVQRVNPQLTQC